MGELDRPTDDTFMQHFIPLLNLAILFSQFKVAYYVLFQLKTVEFITLEGINF